MSIYNGIWIVHDYIKREETRKKTLLFTKFTLAYPILLHLNSYFYLFLWPVYAACSPHV